MVRVGTEAPAPNDGRDVALPSVRGYSPGLLHGGAVSAQRAPRRSERVATGLEHRGVTQKTRKYRNEPVVVNGLHFASKAEGARYMGLYVAVQMGEIRDLEIHPRFPLVIHGEDCGDYEADFGYVVVSTGERVIEDVKSAPTRKLPTYRLKARLVWALYGLKIREVM